MDRNEFSDYKKEHKEKYNIPEGDYHYALFISVKNAKVMMYDCYDEETPVLFELNGGYNCYYNCGKVYFENIDVPWK